MFRYFESVWLSVRDFSGDHSVFSQCMMKYSGFSSASQIYWGFQTSILIGNRCNHPSFTNWADSWKQVVAMMLDRSSLHQQTAVKLVGVFLTYPALAWNPF